MPSPAKTPAQDPAQSRQAGLERPGNRRVTGKEQYYTPPSVAASVLDDLEAVAGPLEGRVLLEPAGGTGAFIDAAMSRGIARVLSVDIEPHHPHVIRGDFLTATLDVADALVASNPPFGRNNSLSIPFFNRAAERATHIAFIVPRSWRKWTVINRLDSRFHLASDRDLHINYVDVHGALISAKSALRTCVQVWERREVPRPLYRVRDMGLLHRCPPGEADVSLTVFGYGCGTVRTDFERVPNTTQAFLKLTHPGALDALLNADLKRFSVNTAYTEALSLQEVNYAVNAVLFGDPKLEEVTR